MVMSAKMLSKPPKDMNGSACLHKYLKPMQNLFLRAIMVKGSDKWVFSEKNTYVCTF